MQGTSILIVDDDKAQQLRLVTLLEQDGYQVYAASSGEEAIKKAHTSLPDMVLSDVMMDAMDGYELAMRFKGDPALRHIPIALHSSIFNDAKDRLLAEAIGVDAFFDKSISFDQLLQQLKEMREGPRPDNHNSFDENKFLRMRSRVLSDKVGSKNTELEIERQRADTTAHHLQTITDALPDLISELDTDCRYRYINRAYEQWHGKPYHEIIGLHVKELHGKEAFNKIRPYIDRALRGETVKYEEFFDYPGKGLRNMWVRYHPYFDNEGKVCGIHVIVRDITKRKADELQLQKTNRYYLVMLQINQLIASTENEQALLDGACDIICHSGNYPLAWIGRVEDDAEQRIVPIAQAGFKEGYLDSLYISWGDSKFGQGPTGMAVRSGSPQLAEDILHDPNFAPWREAALEYGYASSIALPISIEHETIATLNIYSSKAYAFSDRDTELLKKLAADIGQGIHTLRLKYERQQIENSLRKANHAYRTLVQLKKSLLRHHNEADLLEDVCKILISDGAYHLAWIGYAKQDVDKTLSPVASAGDKTGYLEEMLFSWGDNTLGKGPTGRCVRHAGTVIINDTATDPDFRPWRAAAKRQGYASIIAIPLKESDRVFGSLTLYADVSNAFYPEEVELLEEFADELAFGITALRQHDKHQRIESELAYQRKLFEAVFRHIPDTMVITDTKHRIILCNSALIRDFGYLPEELLGQSPALLYSDKPEFERQQQLRFHTEAYDIHTPYNMEYRRKDGTTFHGETLGASFRDKDKNLLGYITIVRDITERQAMEVEQLQLEQQLQQAQKMETVGHLTGGIAHDFNNILASILGYTELSQIRISSDDGNSKRLQNYLNEIQAAGERARDIISQLLAFSRTDSSAHQLVALQPLLEETASLLRPTLSSSIDVSLDIEQQLPQIDADPNQLHQVLMNLCVNARDAMKGRGSIKIGLHHVGNYQGLCQACGEKFSDDYLRLSVRDNGSGIPDEVMHRMFDPFFTTKEIGKGSGMGLSMVHGIIHNHRGHIQVTTSSDGTLFELFLPTASNITEESSESAPHIVIIDDEPLVLEFLQQLLMFNGYQVTKFAEPGQALDALVQQQLPCDLVITDKIMPGISGTELAHKLHQHRADLPILLCSRERADLNEEMGSEYGIMGYLPKPIESVHLISQIQKLLSNKPKSPVKRCHKQRSTTKG